MPSVKSFLPFHPVFAQAILGVEIPKENGKKSEKGKYQTVVSEKKWKSLKTELEEDHEQTTPLTFDQRIAQLKTVHRGWINYNGKHARNLTGKERILIRLGIANGQAYAWSRTRMGGWAVAPSPILRTTINVERLIKRGYESMSSYCEKYLLILMNAVCVIPGSFGIGVRGEPRCYLAARPSTRLAGSLLITKALVLLQDYFLH